MKDVSGRLQGKQIPIINAVATEKGWMVGSGHGGQREVQDPSRGKSEEWRSPTRRIRRVDQGSRHDVPDGATRVCEDSSQSWKPVVRTGGEQEVVGGQGKGMEPRSEAEEEQSKENQQGSE